MLRTIPSIGALAASLALLFGASLGAAAPVHSVAIPNGAQVRVNGTSAMMMSNGETGTFQCTCNKGKGTCKLIRQPSSMICDSPGGAGACTGECVFFTGTTGVTGAAAARSTNLAPVRNAP